MVSELTLAETRAMLQYVAREMIACRDLLGEADRAIGDGDHGVGMARGFEAVLGMLENDASGDLKELFQKVGMALITSMGGASGIIFGTWFTGSSKGLAGKTVFDGEGVKIFLETGLKAIQERGKAKAGDKTMVDVLVLACSAAAACETQTLDEVCEQVSFAAAQGAENTKGMVATLGRARSLGQRSIGYIDPGALSASLILKFMHQYLNSKAG